MQRIATRFTIPRKKCKILQKKTRRMAGLRGVDAVGGSSNRFREDVLRLYELSEHIRMRESNLERLKKGPNGPISAAG